MFLLHVSTWQSAFFVFAPEMPAIRNRLGLNWRGSKFRILNVGSGPAREVREGIESCGLRAAEVEVVCVDIDAAAIDYAKRLLGAQLLACVSFHHGNALRYNPKTSFDFIWSAGLFDDRDERRSAFLLRTLWKAQAPSGKLVVGNFAHKRGEFGDSHAAARLGFVLSAHFWIAESPAGEPQQRADFYGLEGPRRRGGHVGVRIAPRIKRCFSVGLRVRCGALQDSSQMLQIVRKTTPARTVSTVHDYRPDIDGLRAFAVLSVVLYHAFPQAVRGGYVGVDVFFVISGFLITSILFAEITEARFSFIAFYGRRVRRIFPALALCLTAVLAYGFVLLMPFELAQLGKHVFFGAGFLSNIALWSESGYFDASASSKPLLHLWSLGVEEQFYILWPALLWIAFQMKAAIGRLLGLLFLGSVNK